MRGKVNFDVSEINPDEDHPRLCGEKGNPASRICPVQGSPPPMRGKAQQVPQTAAYTGITPAYAGKSFEWGGYVERV